MIALIVFIAGLALGSFISVLWARLEAGQPKRRARTTKTKKPVSNRGILTGRSRCDHCGHLIAWYDNIPLVSFLLLRGTCRHCRKHISHYHPVLELSAGLYLVAAYLAYGLSVQLAISAIFGPLLLLILAYDLKHQLIPNKVVLPGIALALLLIADNVVLQYAGYTPVLGLWSSDPASYLVGGLAAGGFFLLLSLFSRGKWIGGGDIKLGFLIGLLLGWPYVLVALILAYLIGTAYAIGLLLGRKASLQTAISFGPMLVMGFFVAQFYGAQIIDWYWRWFW